MEMKYNVKIHRQLADTLTPVGLYLLLRDKYRRTLLFESSDYHGEENSFSYICCEPLTEFVFTGREAILRQQSEIHKTTVIDFKHALKEYMGMHLQSGAEASPVNGIYGYISYEAAACFDSSLKFREKPGTGIPLAQYAFYRFVIGINHFNSELFVVENIPEGASSQMEAFIADLNPRYVPEFPFSVNDEVLPSMPDEAYRNMVSAGKRECRQGNVFQVVLSRQFSVPFSGDEFNVYRALRNINPSPYLFYYDGGDFRIFGSSPEAQLVVKEKKAYIFPIAGTFRRTGNAVVDMKRAEELKADPKENAEHMMLVDLARNDLSVCCNGVSVESLAEIQFYSHVIHMVSKVSGKLRDFVHSVDVLAATFPAGTLSGAPKFRAMQLIDELETEKREYYGGALGFLGFNGEVNKCIIIRSFLSRNNTLSFKAGAGIVIASEESGELEEVNNKLSALHKALKGFAGNKYILTNELQSA
ncbi:MAG: anthranilate synthase component I family protein [Bacteroidia bacterium]|nr:anthranilate synthase component I family protein [Bacteroidia bacterium]